MDAMARLFADVCVRRFLDAPPKAAPPQAQDDSEAFLWRLWALKDPRPDA
jgi:hypothetical protein